jgi:hypothetical protein
MNYTIFITAVSNERTRNIVARHIAAHPDISLQKARFMLGHLPVLYREDLDRETMEKERAYLTKIGARVSVAEAKSPLSNTPPEPPVDLPQKKNEAAVRYATLPTHPPAAQSSLSPRPPRYFSSSSSSKPKSHSSPMRRKLIAAVVVSILIAVGIIIFRQERSFDIPRSPVLHSKSKEKESREETTASPFRTSSANENRQHVRSDSRNRGSGTNGSRKYLSRVYLDSARAVSDDIGRAIKFYKIALSVNEYNLGAWQGLIAAYRAQGDRDKAGEAQREMKELFGDDIFSLSTVMKPFGPVLDFKMTADGVLRLEYRTSARGKQRLIEESFGCARAIHLICNCRTLSLFASTRPGAGLLVYIPVASFPQTQSGFEQKATITYLE